MKRRLIFIAAVSIPAVCLLVVATIIGTVFALQSDVGVLAKRARDALSANKAMRSEVVVLKDDLVAIDRVEKAAQPESATASPVASSASASAGDTADATAFRVIRVAGTASVRPVNANVAGTPECTFRSGGSAGLMDCLRQQQDRIGAIPLRPL
jgi:hypothetical protein